MIKKMLKSMGKNKKGFTLVELMVVVVIIGILTAIAVPVYNTATKKAKTSADAANIRILEAAYQNYVADNDGTKPANDDDLKPKYVKEWPTKPGTYTMDYSTGKASSTYIP